MSSRGSSQLEDCSQSGSHEFDGIPPAPRGQSQGQVCFEIDASGVLNIGARDRGIGKEEKFTVTPHAGRLNQKQIEHTIQVTECRIVLTGQEAKPQDLLANQAVRREPHTLQRADGAARAA